jgi:hypothetical protein
MTMMGANASINTSNGPMAGSRALDLSSFFEYVFFPYDFYIILMITYRYYELQK